MDMNWQAMLHEAANASFEKDIEVRSAADDDAYGQVHHIAPGDKGLELLDEGSHKQKASFLFLEALR